METEITMEDCVQVQNIMLQSEYSKSRSSDEKHEYLCPQFKSKIVVGGNMSSRDYQYVQMSVEACNPTVSDNCKST